MVPSLPFKLPGMYVNLAFTLAPDVVWFHLQLVITARTVDILIAILDVCGQTLSR
jgi:hypothetical protein